MDISSATYTINFGLEGNGLLYLSAESTIVGVCRSLFIGVGAQALFGSGASLDAFSGSLRVEAFLMSLRCIFFPMPRKIREKKVLEVKDRTEEWQDWFLLQSACRLECREPSRLSGDLEERKGRIG